ncbi:hypothetical protein FORC13_p067 (plasmid) [Bacillus cereus]|nr:hypothetical protein FORC13_p067 [Bacillus cereus]
MIRCMSVPSNKKNAILSKTKAHKAAKRFFKKTLRSFHVSNPGVITMDKNPAYPMTIDELKKEKKMSTVIQIVSNGETIISWTRSDEND